MKLKAHINQLASLGRYYFTLSDIQAILGSSPSTTWAMLNRLVHKGEVCSPYRGFYLIIPPEYQTLGCLPPEQFIPNLLQFLGLPYYVGLVTAAQYYGAGHQQSHIFQVMVESPHRPVQCGKVHIQFIAKKNLLAASTHSFNTPRGIIRVAAPEVIAVDLISYSSQSGGLNHVATILAELAEKLDAQKLLAIADSNSNKLTAIFQRLGYLLEQVEAKKLAAQLWEGLHKKFLRVIPLQTKYPMKGAIRNTRWKIAVNTEIESDL